GRRAALPFAAAAKTGTSQGFRDAWFVGYSADVAAAVWVGNDDGTAMNRVVGGSLPADIWHDLMLAAHNGRQPAPLQGLVTSSLPQAALPQTPSSHPQEAIGDDFIARALQNAEPSHSDRGSRAQARDPDDGRMSLGRFGD